jgi:hypothetical protein
MRKRRSIELFSLSFLDLISGALGAVIILYVAIPKNKPTETSKSVVTKEIKKEVAKDVVPVLYKEEPKSSGKIDADIGFNFKGKNLVFLIDTSYSMIEEDRMTQVKAGIKMLLTSLPSDYKVEVIQFPLGEEQPYRSLWGKTQDFNTKKRMEAFDFIYSLKPWGGTPTRDTLMFVLGHYKGISDIILLTDGAPTFHNSDKKDDIYDLARQVRDHNFDKIQINTIGVGVNFVKDQESEQFRFLDMLSHQSKGFFVSF